MFFNNYPKEWKILIFLGFFIGHLYNIHGQSDDSDAGIENQFEFGVSGDTFSVIYTIFYGVILTVIFLWVLRLKKQLGYEDNIFLLLWSLEDVVLAPVLHIIDTASDIGVLISFYSDMQNQIRGTGKFANGENSNINMIIFFSAAMIIFTFYRLKSSIDCYRVTHSYIRGICQFIFDSELFVIVYVNLSIGETEPIGLLKYYRGEEALFESTLQCILQFVFLLSQQSNVDTVIFVSFIFSLESIFRYGGEIDGQNLIERATHEWTIEEALCRGDYCCCNIKKRRGTAVMDNNTAKKMEKELEINVVDSKQEKQPNIEAVKSMSEMENDNKESKEDNKGDENKEAAAAAEEAEEEEEEEEEKGDWCFGQLYSEWVIAFLWRHLDAVSQVFTLSLIWAVLGFYWFMFTMIFTIFCIFLIIRKQANAWAWEYLYVIIMCAIFPERSRPEDSLLTTELCCIFMFTKNFWRLQYIYRAVLWLIVTIILFSPFDCFDNESEFYGCVPYNVRQSRVIEFRWGLAAYFIAIGGTILCPIIYYYKISKWVVACKRDKRTTLSNGINQAIFHNDFVSVKALLKYGIDVNEFDETGCTALWAACSNGNKQVLDALLADPKIQPSLPMNNAYGSSCLHGACIRTKPEIVKLLIKHPAIDVNFVDKRGMSPLDCAKFYDGYFGKDNTEIINLLKEAGGKYNIFNEEMTDPDTQNFVAFCMSDPGWIVSDACVKGWTKVIADFVTRKDHFTTKPFNVDHKNKMQKSMTGLQIAAKKGYTDTVKLLLEHGYDPKAKQNDLGKNALELAEEEGHTETANVIREFCEAKGIKSPKSKAESAPEYKD